jgi:hypothetical protein
MTSRNSRTATTAKFAGTILITALIGAVTAAADDISEVAVTNSGKLRLKVVILSEPGFGELGRSSSPDFISGNSGHGTVHLKSRVKTYHWEVFALGPDGHQDTEPCDSDHRRGVSASSITVGCDHTIAGGKKPAPPAAPPVAAATAPPTNSAQSGGQQKAECPVNERRSDMSCPPKSPDVQQLAKLKTEGEDAVKALDKAESDLGGVVVNPKDPKAAIKKIIEIGRQYNDARRKINHYRTMLGHEPDQLNIDFNRKLPSVEKDVYAELKNKLNVLGCEWTQTSGDLDMDKLAACEGKMDAGGGGRK